MPQLQSLESHAANEEALYDMLNTEKSGVISDEDREAYRQLIAEQKATDPTRFETKDLETGEIASASVATVGDKALHHSGVGIVHSEGWQTEEK